MEDKFFTFNLMALVSDELSAAGFKHVISRHHIDPEWRAQCRPYRPELEPIAWSVAITEFLIPLPKIKILIEICERHNLVVWWGTNGSVEEEGRTLYFVVGTNERAGRAYITPLSQ